MKTILKCNPDVIIRGLIEKKLTVRDAAKECGLSYSSFRIWITTDKRVGYKSAGKLRAFFGDDAISVFRED